MNAGKYAIKDENFISIQGWMRTKLNLKGNELMLYALIYGFTQDGDTWFTGTLKYMADWVGVESKNIYGRYIKPLIDKGLLIKEEYFIGNLRMSKYKTVVPESSSIYQEISDYPQNETTSPNLREGVPQNDGGTSLKMRDNNISNNLDINNVVVEEIDTTIDELIDGINKTEYYEAFKQAGESSTKEADKAAQLLRRLLKSQNSIKKRTIAKFNIDQIIKLFYVALEVQDNIHASYSNPNGYLVSRINKEIEKTEKSVHENHQFL